MFVRRARLNYLFIYPILCLPAAKNNSEVDETQQAVVFPTFTASLQLDARYMDEFLAGNFLYLRPKSGFFVVPSTPRTTVFVLNFVAILQA